VLSDSPLPAIHHVISQSKVSAASRPLLTLLLGEAGDHAHQRLVAPAIHVQPAAGHSRRGALRSQDQTGSATTQLAVSSPQPVLLPGSSGRRAQSCSGVGRGLTVCAAPRVPPSCPPPRSLRCTHEAGTAGRAKCGDRCCRSMLHLQSEFRAGGQRQPTTLLPPRLALSVSGSQMSMSMPLRTPISLPLLGAITGWLPICGSGSDKGATDAARRAHNAAAGQRLHAKPYTMHAAASAWQQPASQPASPPAACLPACLLPLAASPSSHNPPTHIRT
jgi:hypothetical protein